MKLLQKIALPVLVILALLMVGVSGYLYKKVSVLKQTPDAAIKAETDALVEEISKIILLPAGETPTLATVTDPALLKDQAFFAKAKAGDKVLLYGTAKKAFLYDPVAKKIVEVAPINLGEGN